MISSTTTTKITTTTVIQMVHNFYFILVFLKFIISFCVDQLLLLFVFLFYLIFFNHPPDYLILLHSLFFLILFYSILFYSILLTSLFYHRREKNERIHSFPSTTIRITIFLVVNCNIVNNCNKREASHTKTTRYNLCFFHCFILIYFITFYFILFYFITFLLCFHFQKNNNKKIKITKWACVYLKNNNSVSIWPFGLISFNFCFLLILTFFFSIPKTCTVLDNFANTLICQFLLSSDLFSILTINFPLCLSLTSKSIHNVILPFINNNLYFVLDGKKR